MVSTGCRSWLWISFTRYGAITWPPLAIVATIIAFCSGVSATSRCPMADCCSAATSGIDPIVDGATGSGISRSAMPILNASACARIACTPSCASRSANAVLQERCSASRRLTVGPVPHALPL